MKYNKLPITITEQIEKIKTAWVEKAPKPCLVIAQCWN